MRNADDASQLTQRDLSRYFCVAPARPVLCSEHRAHKHARACIRVRNTRNADGWRERGRPTSSSFNLYIQQRGLTIPPYVPVSRSAATFRGEIESNRVARFRRFSISRESTDTVVEMINRSIEKSLARDRNDRKILRGQPPLLYPLPSLIVGRDRNLVSKFFSRAIILKR